MRQSIGGAWLFSISIILMMFIIAYVTITIDYSNAYQLKDDVSLYIEQYNGLNDESARLIVGRMKAAKYTLKVRCNEKYDTTTYYHGNAYEGNPYPHYQGLTSYSNTSNPKANFTQDAQTAYICIYKYQIVKGSGEDKMDKVFYNVTTVFGFNFPIIGNMFNYRVTGETGAINYPNDTLDFGTV